MPAFSKLLTFQNFYKFLLSSLIFVLCTVTISTLGCSAAKLPRKNEGCKTRTYVNLAFEDYISLRYSLEQKPRLAIVPFEVPESFAPPGNESLHFGRDLAILFQREFLRAEQPQIVELFNRDRWPGKRADFFTGNYASIQQARAAGYDFVMVGYMDDIKNDSDLSLYTKLIDTSNGITIWYARTVAYSNAREWRNTLSALTRGVFQDRPELFQFNERAELLAECTVDKILHVEQVAPSEEKQQQAAPTRQPLPR